MDQNNYYKHLNVTYLTGENAAFIVLSQFYMISQLDQFESQCKTVQMNK